MPKYELVNPHIGGTIDTSSSASNGLQAADTIWTRISKFFTNDVPSFPFTLRDTVNDTFFHYEVKEKKGTDGVANYKIKEIDVSVDPKTKQYLSNPTKYLSGGRPRRSRDDDDDDSSSDEIFETLRLNNSMKKYSLPIEYWWYYPTFYNRPSVFIPTFVQPIVPYIEYMTLIYYP
jgi:hypothetical protein